MLEPAIEYAGLTEVMSHFRWRVPGPKEAQPWLRAMPFRVSAISVSDNDIPIAFHSRSRLNSRKAYRQYDD